MCRQITIWHYKPKTLRKKRQMCAPMNMTYIFSNNEITSHHIEFLLSLNSQRICDRDASCKWILVSYWFCFILNLLFLKFSTYLKWQRIFNLSFLHNECSKNGKFECCTIALRKFTAKTERKNSNNCFYLKKG